MKRQPKAKTAYELLERVCAHILEEPKRYHQDYWGLRGEVPLDVPRPKCGTVCCRAGWIVALNDGPKALLHTCSGSRADRILGMTDEDTRELFYDDSVERFRQGTKRYANAGAAGIRRFMKKHKRYLQARALKGV